MAFRCKCHDRLFQHEHDYIHHMNSMPFRGVKVDNYQDWLDNIDTSKPLPKLVKPPTNFALRRLTGGYKLYAGPPHTSRPTHSIRRNNANDKSKIRRRLHSVAPHLHRLLLTVQQSRVSEGMLRYLLAYGSGELNDELLPPSLSIDTMQEAVFLFSGLDTDGDGFIAAADLTSAGELLGIQYNQHNFRKMDQRRTGIASLEVVLRIIFPTYSRKRIMNMQHQLGVVRPKIRTTKEHLSASDAAEIDTIYKMFSSKPGGCTLQNMLKVMSGYQYDYVSDFRRIFAAFDEDGDGVLSHGEFLELVKYNYPPFKPREGPVVDMTTLPPITERIAEIESNPIFAIAGNFRIEPPRVVSQIRSHGAAECMEVKRAKETVEHQEIGEMSELLHLLPIVKRFTRQQ